MHIDKDTWKYSYNTTATASFDITASFDGIETDTQMRYASNNDAHFVMNFNSMFNPNNQSGVEPRHRLRRAGLQHRARRSPRAPGCRPPTTSTRARRTCSRSRRTRPATPTASPATSSPTTAPARRTCSAPTRSSCSRRRRTPTTSGDTVVDPIWLANSPDADAVAMRSAQATASIPWRLLYRVTYSERFLPPVSTEAVVVPQITPVMAVPVLDPGSRLPVPGRSLRAGAAPGEEPGQRHRGQHRARRADAVRPERRNRRHDRARTRAADRCRTTSSRSTCVKTAATDRELGRFGQREAAHAAHHLGARARTPCRCRRARCPARRSSPSRRIPVSGGTLYSIYTDPNGLTVNVPTNFGHHRLSGRQRQPDPVLRRQDVPLAAGRLRRHHRRHRDVLHPAASTYDQSRFNLLGDYDLLRPSRRRVALLPGRRG